jgi:hypothetical protein
VDGQRNAGDVAHAHGAGQRRRQRLIVADFAGCASVVQAPAQQGRGMRQITKGRKPGIEEKKQAAAQKKDKQPGAPGQRRECGREAVQALDQCSASLGGTAFELFENHVGALLEQQLVVSVQQQQAHEALHAFPALGVHCRDKLPIVDFRGQPDHGNPFAHRSLQRIEAGDSVVVRQHVRTPRWSGMFHKA